MGKAEENKKAKLERLMDNAFRLFLDKGISKTTISDIAAGSGIAKGTFYLYFKDKYDLRDKLISHRAKLLFEHALKNSDYTDKETPEEKIIAITDSILNELQDNPRLLRFINKNLSWGIFENALQKSDMDFQAVIGDILGMDRDSPKLRITAFMVIEFIGATCHSIILNNDPVTPEKYKPYLHNSISAIIHAACMTEDAQD